VEKQHETENKELRWKKKKEPQPREKGRRGGKRKDKDSTKQREKGESCCPQNPLTVCSSVALERNSLVEEVPFQKNSTL